MGERLEGAKEILLTLMLMSLVWTNSLLLFVIDLFDELDLWLRERFKRYA